MTGEDLLTLCVEECQQSEHGEVVVADVATVRTCGGET